MGYIVQMYWLPADRLQERVQQDKIPYGKWFDRGLLRLCAGNIINYSDVTAWFVETVKQYDLFPAWASCDSYSARYFVEEMQMQGVQYGSLHIGRENAVPAHADVRGRPASPQGDLTWPLRSAYLQRPFCVALFF